MARTVTAEELTAALARVVDERYNGKPLFLWPSRSERLRGILNARPGLADRVEWLDVNDLAEDVIPRRAREVFREKLASRLDQAASGDVRVLVVVNPYLLLRYEPAAPLGAFWNRFADNRRATIVVLPGPVARPPTLPGYVQFRGDRLATVLAETHEAVVVSDEGG